ncbi:MAG: 30S ribosomal protein S17e [Candidatus Woesearchaeota archaeon]
MGRIKTQLIKRVTHELMHLYKDKFKDNFEENKALVEKYTDVPSKKMRDVIAGYVTRLKKSKRYM